DTVIELSGKLCSTVSAQTREKVLSLIEPGCRVVLDLSKLTEVSGCGARILLLFIRGVRAVGGTASVIGVSPNLVELADAAGFLPLFQENLPSGPASGVDRLEVPRIDAYPTHEVSGYAVRLGFPIPFGAKPVGRGINFAVYSRHAAACTL